jgi:hypothetical protein
MAHQQRAFAWRREGEGYPLWLFGLYFAVW